MSGRALPTDRHIDDLTRRIANYPAIQMGASLKAVMNRARKALSNTPDGYTNNTLSGARGGTELTSVEAAAGQRIDGRQRDPVDEHLRRATMNLEAVAIALDVLTVSINALANITTDVETENERKCWAMARVGAIESFYRRVTIDGAGYDLGRFAFDFYMDTGALPTIEQCRQRALGHNVKHRIDPTR